MDLSKFQHPHLDSYENYNGIRIYAASDLHESAFKLFEKYSKNKNAKILILGAGGGAFDQRLIDNGFTNITSIDLISEDYKIKNTNFICKNLNQDFSDLGKFDAIIALEIIEHVENQFHFIRNIAELLSNDGFLILSTPNINSKFARLKFFLSGKLWYFREQDLSESGHINVILPHVFEYNIESNNLKILEKTYNKELYPKIGKIFSLRSLIGFFIYTIIYFFMKGENREIDIYCIKKND